MEKRDVLVLLTDRWADWEAAYAIAEVNSTEEYSVKTIAADKLPKISIGGIRAQIDEIIGEYCNFKQLALLILPGGFAWAEEPHNEIADFVKKALHYNVPVAAICGATIFLGKHGILNNTKHTGDDLEYFTNQPGYGGQPYFVEAQIVEDNGIITANETAAVDFAKSIFKLLKIDTDDEIDSWYDKFKYGYPAATP